MPDLSTRKMHAVRDGRYRPTQHDLDTARECFEKEVEPSLLADTYEGPETCVLSFGYAGVDSEGDVIAWGKVVFNARTYEGEILKSEYDCLISTSASEILAYIDKRRGTDFTVEVAHLLAEMKNKHVCSELLNRRKLLTYLRELEDHDRIDIYRHDPRSSMTWTIERLNLP